MATDIGKWQYPQISSGNVPTPPPAGMESPGVYVTSGGVTAVEQTPFGLQATRISSIGTIAETPTVHVSAEAAKELHPEKLEVARVIRKEAQEFESMLPAGYGIALEKQGEGLILTGELKPGLRIEPGPPSYISAEPEVETLVPGYLEEEKFPAVYIGGKPSIPKKGMIGGGWTSASGKGLDIGKLTSTKFEPSVFEKFMSGLGFGKKEKGISLVSGLPEIGTRTLGLETAGFEFNIIKEATPMMQTEAFRYSPAYEEKLAMVSTMKPKEDVLWKALPAEFKEGLKRVGLSVFPKYEEEYKEGIIPFMPSGMTRAVSKEEVAPGTWGAPAKVSLTAEEAVKSGAAWNLPKGIMAGFIKAPTVLSLGGAPDYGKYPGGALGEFIGQIAFWKGMGEVFRMTAQTPAQTAYKEWISKPQGRIKESMGVAETISGEKYPTYFETKFIVEPGKVSKGYGIISAISEIKGKTAVSLVPVSVISKTKEGMEVGVSMAKAITEYNKEIITGTEAGRFISRALPSGSVLKLGETSAGYRLLTIKPGSWGIAAETLSAEGKGGIVSGIAEQMPSDFGFGFTSGKKLSTQLINTPSIATAGMTKAVAKNIGEIIKSIGSERITKGALALGGLSIVIPKTERGTSAFTSKIITSMETEPKTQPLKEIIKSQPFNMAKIIVTGGESFVGYPKWDIDTITKTFLTPHPPQKSIAVPAQVISKPSEAAFSQIGKLYPPELLQEEPKARRVLTIPREQLEMSPLQRKMIQESGFAPRTYEFDWEKYAGGRVMGLQPKSGTAQFSKTGNDIMKQQKQYSEQLEKQRRKQEKDYAQAGIGFGAAGARKVISTTAQQQIITPRMIHISTPSFEEMQQTGITPKVAQVERTDFEDYPSYPPFTSFKTPPGFPPIKTIGFPKPSGARRTGERQREDFYRKFEKESGMGGLKRAPFKEVDWGFRQWGSKVPVKRRREASKRKGRKRR